MQYQHICHSTDHKNQISMQEDEVCGEAGRKGQEERSDVQHAGSAILQSMQCDSRSTQARSQGTRDAQMKEMTMASTM